MSYYGSQHPPPGKKPPGKKKKQGFGGFKLPTGSSGAPGPSPSSRPPWTPSSGTPSSRPPLTPSSGSTYSPSSSSARSSGSKPLFGGFKMPTFGGGAGGSSGGGFGGIWGAEPTMPGPTATWSESTRLLVAVGAFALIVLAAGLLIFGIAKGGKTKPAGAPAVTVQTTKFVPPTTAQGGKTQLTVTFSDGTTADILYDPSVGLAELGVNPLDSGMLSKFARAGRQFQIDHGAATFVLNESPTPAPSGFPGAQAPASVPVLPAATPTPGSFLDFKFGDWRVGVWEGTGDDQMAAADDQTWASNLVGTVTPSGFLVLTAKPPLQMTPFGAASGPALLFGDIFTTGALLTPTSCVPPSGANAVQNANGVPVRVAKTAGDHYEGDLCLKDKKLDFELFGTQQFVRSATDSIEVRNFKPGPRRG